MSKWIPRRPIPEGLYLWLACIWLSLVYTKYLLVFIYKAEWCIWEGVEQKKERKNWFSIYPFIIQMYTSIRDGSGWSQASRPPWRYTEGIYTFRLTSVTSPLTRSWVRSQDSSQLLDNDRKFSKWCIQLLHYNAYSISPVIWMTSLALEDHPMWSVTCVKTWIFFTTSLS